MVFQREAESRPLLKYPGLLSDFLLTKNRSAILQVIDEGKGIQARNGENRVQDWMGAFGVGLRGMNERMRQLGGDLEISSAQEGTTVTATLPLPDADSGD